MHFKIVSRSFQAQHILWVFTKTDDSEDSSVTLCTRDNFSSFLLSSNGLDPDQDRHCVGPDLDPKGLQRLSADDKSRR